MAAWAFPFPRLPAARPPHQLAMPPLPRPKRQASGSADLAWRCARLQGVASTVAWARACGVMAGEGSHGPRSLSPPTQISAARIHAAAASRASRRDLERRHRSRTAVADPHVGRPLHRHSSQGGLLSLGRSRPCTPSSPAPATSSPAWLPCAPLPCTDISARAAACHRASHLLTARADTQQRQPFEHFPSLVSTPLVRSAVAPSWLDPPHRPPPLLLPLLVLSL